MVREMKFREIGIFKYGAAVPDRYEGGVITMYSFESELALAESHYYDHGLGDKRKFNGQWFSRFTFVHKNAGLNFVKELLTKLRAKGYCAEYVPAHQFANYSVGFFIVPWLAKGWEIYYRHKC